MLPGHIHAFYITCTYFSRKRKVRKGRYPGGRKAGIYSENVWNGGASNEKVKELWIKQQRELEEKEMSRGGSWLSRKGTKKGDEEVGVVRGKSRRTSTVGREASVRR